VSPSDPRHRNPPVRLWTAALRLPRPLDEHLAAYGRPIRYGCDAGGWSLATYQTVFADEPGSAEMPSAARGFTPELVTRLVSKGVVVAPIVLHTGVASQEAGEPPYPERFRVGAATAAAVNNAKAAGHRIVAVGTTATRAIESVAHPGGTVAAGEGWTDLVVTPERGVHVVDGLITGWHDPEASHLLLVEAVGGPDIVDRSYTAAVDAGFAGHEFGDFHLILP
jgi:S-adenosylmethionine:tRNA ribosyltransferase-isomerase